MVEGFEQIALALGVPVKYLLLLVVVMIWETTWKLIAMWKSAKKGHLIWFIIMALVNSVGIIPILYIYVFSKINLNAKKEIKKSKKKKL